MRSPKFKAFLNKGSCISTAILPQNELENESDLVKCRVSFNLYNSYAPLQTNLYPICPLHKLEYSKYLRQNTETDTK